MACPLRRLSPTLVGARCGGISATSAPSTSAPTTPAPTTPTPAASFPSQHRGVRNLPWTEEKVRTVPLFELENRPVIAQRGIHNKAQVGDRGMDGRFFPVAIVPRKRAPRTGADRTLAESPGEGHPIRIEQKGKVDRLDLDGFETELTREDRARGLFVGFE